MEFLILVRRLGSFVLLFSNDCPYRFFGCSLPHLLHLLLLFVVIVTERNWVRIFVAAAGVNDVRGAAVERSQPCAGGAGDAV